MFKVEIEVSGQPIGKGRQGLPRQDTHIPLQKQGNMRNAYRPQLGLKCRK